jgi:hypothetical protein
LTVSASGSAPLIYQWQFNGTAIPGATNATLVLGSIQPAQAGTYHVIITNVVGALVSDPAQVLVLAPPRLDLMYSAGGSIVFSLLTEPGQTYAVLASADLVAWQSLRVFAGTGGRFEFTDAEPPNLPQRFYRIELLP